MDMEIDRNTLIALFKQTQEPPTGGFPLPEGHVGNVISLEKRVELDAKLQGAFLAPVHHAFVMDGQMVSH